MCKTQEESKRFDNFFREIVQESTSKTCITQGSTEGELVLIQPFEFVNINTDVLQTIVGVDCETGLLLCKTKYIRYTELSLYDISRLHRYVVVLKDYRFVSNK
jgi:hypothetical protein